MEKGQTLAFVRDNLPPLQSPNTRLIAAAYLSGIKFSSNKPMLDVVEVVDRAPKRTVTWTMDGASLAKFSPNFPEEEITFTEFKRRFEDLEWCKANPDHPIAYMRGYSDTMNRLRDRLKTMKPLAMVRRGKKLALIPADCPASRREQILGEL